ncbi:MAG: amino acid ABC transporter ATP-binding/permease protein [Acetivibrio ethanolgignens]
MKKDSGFKIMLGLFGMVKPLLGIMCLAILAGCIGNLMATFITVLGGYGVLVALGRPVAASLSVVFLLLFLFAVFRGVLRYAEQSANHYIAFKLLANIRHQVFAALRQLAPAKLEGRDKGNLISIITSDIELLEVFYAHTISPIAIAVITSLFMCIFLGSLHPVFAGIAAFFYLLVGAVIPIANSRRGQAIGQEYRKKYGRLNGVVLDNLYGLEEIQQYGQEKERLETMERYNEELKRISWCLKKEETRQKIETDGAIMAAGLVTALCAGYLMIQGKLTIEQAIPVVIAVMSSFGPTAALSALSNNLNQTLASGHRVLELLKEEPVTAEVCGKAEACKGEVSCESISFSYQEEDGDILTDFSENFGETGIYGICGRSGCGKSTLLKLLMRFYETQKGRITYGATPVNEIDTAALRQEISYVTQETFLFQDTIENNIKVADAEASREEVIEAAKKASVHDFIMSLPEGYDTRLSELGSSVSGGEKQRLGLARAFLHKSRIILLDEPTSNIDSLNEGIILKSLKEEKEDRLILLVSHRKSTMGIAKRVRSME